MWGAMYRSPANLRVLHECRCDLSWTNSDGECAASLAAREGCHDALRYLVDEVGVGQQGS